MPPSRARNPALLREQFTLAQALHQRGRLAEAERLYRDILQVDPRHVDALHYLGLIALQQNEAERGVRLIETALALKPNYAEALANLGIGYAELGRAEDALGCYDQALALRSDMMEVHDSRGNLLRDLGQHEAAIASYDRALALRPDDAGALSNRGNALRDLGRYDAALADYDQAVALHPRFIEARCNRAATLHAIGRDADALAEFDTAVLLMPEHAEAHYGRASLLYDLRQPEAALASFAAALDLRPDYAEAQNGAANALFDLHRFDEALACYQQAADLAPAYAAPRRNIGNIHLALRREDVALAHLDEAIALWPEDAEAHRMRGLALVGLKRYADALASFRQAEIIAPDTPWLLGDKLSVKRQMCDWTTEWTDLAALAQALDQGRRAAAPFTLMALSDSPALQLRAAEIFAQSLYPALSDPVPCPATSGRPKIHVGYFSADFRDHAMMHVMIDLFASHDRSRFEVTAFSFGPDTADAWRERVRHGVDRFVDVRTMTDAAVADLARTLRVDIAVDLMGFTLGCRCGIFRNRAAPVQVNYLGYPGTLGADILDYLIADPILVRPGEESFYAEAIVTLPDTYQANTRMHPVPTQPATRQQEELPESAFVFCCFNNSYKLAPSQFEAWMRILHRVPDSVLWLVDDNPVAVRNLRRQASSRGIAPDRLVFAARQPLAEHLDRLRLADLCLDTLPYTGHATSSLALRAGVPLVARAGNTLAGRVAASLLHAVGMPELVADSAGAYEALAVGLATDRPLLHALRTKLTHARASAPLFDTARFARHLEAAFEAMHSRALAGLPPASIQVDALQD